MGLYGDYEEGEERRSKEEEGKGSTLQEEGREGKPGKSKRKREGGNKIREGELRHSRPHLPAREAQRRT
jgi:hypothetical protein